MQNEYSSQRASKLHVDLENKRDEMEALVQDALGIHDFPIDNQQDDDGVHASHLDGITEGERPYHGNNQAIETFNQLMEDVNKP
ncbi:hypothetical protein SLA2020_346340 [Shorea laevis]